MSKPLIYVAGPITGDPWGCVRRATQIASTLEEFDCLAYLPQLSVLHEIVEPRDYGYWIEHGLAMVERCDGVWRLHGESPGADREVEHAERLGLPVLAPSAENAVSIWAPGGFDDWLCAVRGRASVR